MIYEVKFFFYHDWHVEFALDWRRWIIGVDYHCVTWNIFVGPLRFGAFRYGN